jgi:autotransporter-associated beta strand protein
MKRRNRNLAAVAMATTMACGAFARAGITIGDWQSTSLDTMYNAATSSEINTGPSDGWFDWNGSGGGGGNSGDPGADAYDYFPNGTSTSYNTYNYATTPTQSVTLGTQSLEFTPYTGNTQNLSLKTEYGTDSEGNAEKADFFNNTEFTIQVTYNATQWSSGAGIQSGLALNAQTYGFHGQPTNYSNNSFGPPNYDTGNPSNPGNWDATDYASPSTNGVTTRTMTFYYGNLLPGGSGNSAAVSSGDPTGTIPATAGWVELIMQTNIYGQSAPFGNIYFSNAQFTNSAVNTSWQAQQHAQGTSYNWGTINNFTPFSESTGTGGMPCNPGDTVTFGTNIPTGITETIDLNENLDFQISVGTMIFDNTNSSYLIDQGTAGTLTLNGNTVNPSSGTPTPGTSAIDDEGGNHTISAPVALATNTTVAVTASSIFTISGNISGASGLTAGGTTLSSGLGTVALSGLNTYTGGTSVTSGVLEILPTATPSATVSALAKGAVAISGSGKLALAANVTQGSQSGNAPVTAPTSNVNITSLAITGNGTLDINNNHIIIDYTAGHDPISSIAALIKSGYASGAWTGPGIMSTYAQTNSSYGIGYADAADSGDPAGLSSGQIEIMYTLLGDANLDGKVNGSDFTLMATNFNDSVTNGWDEGDFNYSGTVNGDDFVLLASNFNDFASQSAISAADLSALDSFATANGISLTSVPEPASLSVIFLGAAGLLARRRGRRNSVSPA